MSWQWANKTVEEMLADFHELLDQVMPNVIIPSRHQSNPKEHPADRAIREAAEEIASGQAPESEASEESQAAAGMGLALGLGGGGVAIGDKPTLGEFRDTYDENRLMDRVAAHPRVIEALEKMRHEVEEVKGHELVEKNCMLRELTIASEAKNRWDGQGRWLGQENEEMRHGEILSPQQFYNRLGKVTGKGRLKLSEHVMFPNGNSKSGLSGIYVRNPLWDGAAERYREGERAEAIKMADQADLLFKEVKALKKINRDDEADKKLREITALVDEARQKYDQSASASQLAEPEFVRVGTVQWPLMTEWMIMQFTEWGTVCRPKHYGWRTTLLTMIRCGAITPAQAHKAFPVGTGEASGWYLQQIMDFKLQGGVIH